jgi:eukaryotic-like serine/threonine-protein kinase
MRPTPLDQRARRRVGTTLREKYTLSRVLGVGGMAVVYLATHRNGNRVAVKILHAELSLDPGLVARFAREGYVANAIEHRGAVRVLDDDVAEDGSAFLVMELLLGETLEERARRTGGRLPQREVVALAHQLLDVLASAHRKGVVHRDIKPENLFLTRERELKVLDFGIARLRDDGLGPGTAAGIRIGTPAFMPPEQALGRVDEIDARSDVWAGGATLFTLLSGRFVHDADTAAEIVVRSATQPSPALASAAPHVAGALAAVVDRALAFRREDRFPGARVALEAPGCRVLATPESLASDATVWIGAMFPTRGSEGASYGLPAIDAVDLARRDFDETTGGLPPARPGGPRRPIAVVACDDTEEPARVAAYLVDTVGVPAIIGFARSSSASRGARRCSSSPSRSSSRRACSRSRRTPR